MPARPVAPPDSVLEAVRWLSEDLNAVIRFYLRAHYNINTKVDITGERDPSLFDLLNMEFGLKRHDVLSMTRPQINILLRFANRLRTAAVEAERQRLLVEIAELKEELVADPRFGDSGRLMLRALCYRFPDPENRPPAQTPAKKPKRTTAEDRRKGVVGWIEALIEVECWGVTPAEMSKRSGIRLSTLYRYLTHKSVRKTWERYRRESAGKPACNLSDLDLDPGSFSVVDRV
jgi:hypothetical protein